MVATREEVLGVFFASIIGFSITFQLSTSILKRLVQKDGFALEPKHHHTLVSHGPSYVCSMIHCVINGYCGIVQLIGLRDAPSQVKLVFPPVPEEVALYIRGVELSNAFFFAFLAFDLFHVLRLYPKLGGIDTVAHHSVFLTCSIINGGYQILPYPFSWLIIGELSTIFLNIRWALIKTGRGNTIFFQGVQYAFALTFFITRVVIYLYGVFELFQRRETLFEIVSTGRVPGIFMGITLSFVAAGSLLNAIWFQKIAAMAMLKQTKKDTKAT
ncbi:unnamed protein product [Cylindrotheca closterium]|uniref:TLC domain-containing protein n=1 Tax=Cylindrotheca closterium TaxID=2856 RepID=A0AAD2JNP9_9STRA|nr:unnamed protein product [Cylindrotheca closterium]